MINERKSHKFCDPQSITSGIIHFWGFILAIIGTTVLIVFTALQDSDPWKLVSFSIYGASLILLYAASTVYHIFFISDRIHRIFRKIDHCMIYFLIAGTYTPLCLVTLRESVGWVIMTVIWTLSIIGIVIKIFWINAPKWVNSFFYLLLGWFIIVAFQPLNDVLQIGGIFWLIAGGIIYSIGAVIYAAKFIRINTPSFGRHELFHILIIAGSTCHYYLMFNYVM